jgi:RNA polymerase sigma-70 factor (ECF subfamily)
VTIKQGRYTENGKFKAWIMRIAHNLIIDNFRQERNENSVSNDKVDVDLFNDSRLCEKTIEDEMVQEQVFDDIKKMIRHLPDNQREVLEMRYYQDMSFKEIANLTGVSINTALGRMRYAILNMRRMAEENKIELSFV